ncbi:tumor necrosis factor ligand superfamily member 13-like isoform X1 [Hypanus sabinus]|uniref:tumor necrosis factor ligand superfamily member 13-like isoform X1 n=1 Tax=Hypanus sabinus TaxID=79690 RepID=UPI0028C4E3C6|nr:tumor necrosis factor ligand superfamily member 13-like isoform X1 [Hypanus sabinus]
MSWYWVEKGAAVSGLVALAGVLACLLAQGLQTAEMERLRKEVARLRLACGARRGEEESAQFLTAAGQDVSIVHGSTTNPTSVGAVPGISGAQSSRWGGEPAARMERDIQSKPRDRQKWRRSLLHLVPLSISSQGDVTIIHWQKIVHTGKSIEQNHNTISIKGSGYYFIYTQVWCGYSQSEKEGRGAETGKVLGWKE